MRHAPFTFVFLLLLAVPAQAAERRYPVADFDRIVIEGPFEVRLTVGRQASASATGGALALDRVSIDVQGTTLRIRRNPNAWSAAPSAGAPAVVTLTSRTLRSARVIGAGQLDVTGAGGLRLELSVDGGGRLTASRLAADNLALGLRGAGALTVAGTAKRLTADIQGAGTLQGGALVADDAILTAANAGTISLHVRRTAAVTANGLGSIEIAGNPACTVRGPSAAAVRCGSR